MAKKKIRYTADDFSEHKGEIIERNGNLTLVRDEETGKESYHSPHEFSFKEYYND